MNVGFIGLGRMGMPMALNLLNAGFHLTAHNRSRGKVENLAQRGANPAASPQEVTRASEVILTCLPDVPAVEEVYLGEEGVVASARAGHLLIDLSTIGPATARSIARAALARGAAFLDAPVSGGAERAASGTLTIMVGGEEEAFQRASPLLSVLGSTVQHVGPSGAGSTFKLINQFLVGVHTVAAAEALILAARAGMDAGLLLEVLKTSWGSSFMLARNGPLTIARSFQAASAPLRLIFKDLILVEGLAKEVQAPLNTAKPALKFFQEAINRGMSEEDLSAVALILENDQGVPLS